MYFFLILGVPLGFLFLVLKLYPKDEFKQSGRAFARGLLAFIPMWLVARLLGAIVPSIYGSPLLGFHEWADRMLPYAILPAFAYLVFYKPGERLSLGSLTRRLTAFYAGSLAPVGIFETLRVWGRPEPHVLLLLPFLLASLGLAMPKLAIIVSRSEGARRSLIIAAILCASLLASICPYLILAGFWPIALIEVLAISIASWLFARRDLEAAPAIPIL